MKICIPTLDDRGLDARLSDHFGSAPFYTFVDSETGHLDVVANGHHGHEHTHGHPSGGCRALSRITPDVCDAVVCRGMGRGAMSALAQSGIDLFLAEGETVSAIVGAARAGTLKRPAQGQVLCGGHHDPGSGCHS
jgi:predicted Fe-Mo cluster-binding NifX family protein